MTPIRIPIIPVMIVSHRDAPIRAHTHRNITRATLGNWELKVSPVVSALNPYADKRIKRELAGQLTPAIVVSDRSIENRPTIPELVERACDAWSKHGIRTICLPYHHAHRNRFRGRLRPHASKDQR